MRIDSNEKLLKFPLIHLLTGLEFSRHLLRPSYANPTQQRIRQMCFPRLALIMHNHTRDTGWVFSRALRSLHVSPRLTPFICFPALEVECISSRAWRRLQAFPRLTPVKCFPRLAIILRSPAPLNGSLFFPASRWLRVARAKRGVMQIFSPVFLPPFPTH